MKNLAKWGVAALVVLVLSSCGSAFHNGTEMKITSVTVKGLPSSPYAPGTQMYFDLCLDQSADIWVHTDLTNSAYDKYLSAVGSDGTLTYTFSPALVITTATIKFLLIDPSKNWPTVKIDKKHSGKSGGDVVMDNLWTTTAIVGTVSGDDVQWNFE